jgi:septal ring factor EnvC (AmiA/AmiB activator)
MTERRRFTAAERTALGLLVLLLATAADAQLGPRLDRHDVPLPGPAPSAVVANPPLALPAADPWSAPLSAPAASPSPVSTPSSWDALREAESELSRRQEDLDRCRARLGDVNDDLARTREHLQRLDAGTAALRDEVRRRMVLLDRVGRGGATRLVLTSRDPAEARFRASLVRRLVRADAVLAERYATMKAEAEAIRTDLARKLGGQEALERQLDERRRQLSDEVERHRRLLSTLSDPAAIIALAGQSRGELEGFAAALQLRPTAADPRALAALAAAAVAVPASFPVSPDAVHGGVAVDVPAGLPVSAPSAGTVAFAGILAGYGPSVLIRTATGEGLLLGHLAALSVVTGDAVDSGTIVGESAPSYSPLLPPLLVDVLGSVIHES